MYKARHDIMPCLRFEISYVYRLTGENVFGKNFFLNVFKDEQLFQP